MESQQLSQNSPILQ
ncbi:hypothetical protein H811_YJM1400O00360 [Saccharomyces cerevisiae YJM1400]|nr:hypothetical protein H811_YJM1400O00360 [Saccharomyces cerevisiae YJM1400]